MNTTTLNTGTVIFQVPPGGKSIPLFGAAFAALMKMLPRWRGGKKGAKQGNALPARSPFFYAKYIVVNLL